MLHVISRCTLMWHFLPEMMPSSLCTNSYASSLWWWILIPIHFQFPGNKFIGEEIWNLSCNRMYSCHMPSKFKDMINWEINNILQKWEETLWERWKNPRGSCFILSLSPPHYYYCIPFFFFFGETPAFFFLMVAPVFTMIWYIFPHVNTFDKITLTDPDLSLIYVQIILHTSFWVK